MLNDKAIQALGYDLKFSTDGLAMYYLEGKRIKKSQVPTDVLEYFDTLDKPAAPDPTNASVANAPIQRAPQQVPNVQQRELTPASQPRVCLFCGQPAESGRFYAGRVVNLCYEDYQNRTTGEIAQRLRENNANSTNRGTSVQQSEETSGDASVGGDSPVADTASAIDSNPTEPTDLRI